MKLSQSHGKLEFDQWGRVFYGEFDGKRKKWVKLFGDTPCGRGVRNIMIGRAVAVSTMVAVTTLLAVIMSGVSAKEKTSPYVANFTYTPSVQRGPGTADITIAVGKVSYATNTPDTSGVPWFAHSAFDNFDRAFKDDLAEILRANGFNARGPITGELTYSDKKTIDLILDTTIDISIKKSGVNYMVGPYLGKITMEIREPVSRELLRSSSVSFSAPWDAADYWWPNLAREIEKQYPDLMAQVVQQFDLSEMRNLKKQSQEIKAKKGH